MGRTMADDPKEDGGLERQPRHGYASQRQRSSPGEQNTGFSIVPEKVVHGPWCPTCGDTQVVRRSSYPNGEPAPGHYDFAVQCPHCTMLH
jgi:hypothetical protein